MSLATPQSVRKLQRRLFVTAKLKPELRFYSLADKMWRQDVLTHAYRQSRLNGGAAGMDGETFQHIEARGVEPWLAALAESLRSGSYRPSAVRRVMIPKNGGGERPLGIPTIRDRVAQMAAKLVLEPIFEADFDESAYGYRPRRSATQAVGAVHDLLKRGFRDVVDADLSKYFDTIPHDALMKSMARRVVDGRMLGLIRAWLSVPAVEIAEGKERVVTPRGSGQGTPQGGVISPLLANVYMHRFLRAWRDWGMGDRLRAHIVNYADDFVILSRGSATKALEWTRWVMGKIGLTINEKKTRIRDATKETFDFLGYTFGQAFNKRVGRWYMAARPSKKSIGRLRERVRGILHRGNMAPLELVVRELNALLRGWGAYFNYGTTWDAYYHTDRYVTDRVRAFLCRRHKVPSQGHERFTAETIWGQYGVERLLGRPKRAAQRGR